MWELRLGLTGWQFDMLFSAVARSATLQQIWRDAYGDEFPAEAEPFGYVTLTDLRRMAHELRVGAGDTIADLGCGRGGPGLWIARETGASLVGVDFSSVAVQHAAQRAAALGLSQRARFAVRDCLATGLPDQAFAGVVSVDVFQVLPDQVAGLREAARILRPGGHFAFTSWECRPSLPVPPMVEASLVRDYRPLLAQVGLQ
jgi:ubiquinone/menaquinone biosynthesis C-methylase UbiE